MPTLTVLRGQAKQFSRDREALPLQVRHQVRTWYWCDIRFSEIMNLSGNTLVDPPWYVADEKKALLAKVDAIIPCSGLLNRSRIPIPWYRTWYHTRYRYAFDEK